MLNVNQTHKENRDYREHKIELLKTVMVTGNFNVLHPGHIRLLKFAQSCGKKLLVGVFSDQIAQGAVDNPQEMRVEALSSISMVDEVFLIDEPLVEFIQKHQPNIIVKGKEFEPALIGNIFCHHTDLYFEDIGTPSSLRKANEFLNRDFSDVSATRVKQKTSRISK